jgi:hypothetical protein
MISISSCGVSPTIPLRQGYPKAGQPCARSFAAARHGSVSGITLGISSKFPGYDGKGGNDQYLVSISLAYMRQERLPRRLAPGRFDDVTMRTHTACGVCMD